MLQDAVRLAADIWGARLVAAYALGSLAHGGFSVHVSDVDLGLMLSDPLHQEDTDTVAALANSVRAEDAPLADRLSIFWGSPATLRGEATGGRFPPLDRLDLLQYGRLLYGQDVREALPTPTTRELLVAGADFALRALATPEVTAELRNPAVLLHAGVRPLTKTVLFPVRFLYTARTGQMGRNEAAVTHFATTETGAVADLAQQGLSWREEPPDPNDPSVLAILERALMPLYRLFVEEYAVRLRHEGELDRAREFEDWRQRLGEGETGTRDG